MTYYLAHPLILSATTTITFLLKKLVLSLIQVFFILQYTAL